MADPSQNAPTSRLLLPLASIAVMFGAADTYVVVVCLPAMMGSVGLGVDQLQRAAPIISGFLLGYVAMLPLIGRVADLRGRVPVLVAALVTFALGSLVTASSYDLGALVVGRFLQGVGGGGLVPVTLALVADLYPVHRRGVPLGVVGGVQELGSVLGPLYGAAVLALGGWRDVFWINLVVGLVLAGGMRLIGSRRRPHLDPVGLLLLAAFLAGLVLVLVQPPSLVTSVRWGGPFVPFSPGDSVWLSQLGIAVVVLALVLVAWLVLGPRGRVLVDVRRWARSFADADLPGAALLGVALAGVILAFATANPEVAVLSPAGPWLLLVALVALVGFVVQQRRGRDPLVPRGALRRRPAWGSLVVSFFVGAALVAALVDIPIFARVTAYPGSQLHAALVLVELLVAIPLGAVAGGWLTRLAPYAVVAGGGLACSTVGFLLMSGWGPATLHHAGATLTLLLTGLGFGLALAPVNAALLAATDATAHGVSSALLVVARMVGMLVGISALTTIGLRRYYAVAAGFPSPHRVCGPTSSNCTRYQHLLEHAGVEQLQTIFLGAAVCAGLAAVLALTLFGWRTLAATEAASPHAPSLPL